MSTYNDIRVRFEVALNEASSRTIEGNLLPLLNKIFGEGRVNSKNGRKDLRYDLGGDVKKSIESIEGALKKVGLDFFEVTSAAPGQYKDGGNSGKFYTYIVTFNKPQVIGKYKIRKGEVVKFVDNKPPSGTLKSKELTPALLRLPEDKAMNANSLRSEVQSSIQKKYGKSNPHLAETLISLYDLVANHTPKNQKFDNPNAIESFSEDIKYGPELQEMIAGFSDADINTIGKDFGEILGGALMMNITKYSEGVSFPSGNNPLVDFYIDGYGISSKYKDGAAPTLTNIIKDVKPEQFVEDKEKQLYSIFKTVLNNNVIDGYLKSAELLNLPGALKVKEMTGLSELSGAAIEQFIQGKIEEIGFDEFFNEYVVDLNNYVGRGSTKISQKVKDKLIANNKFVGLFSYAVTMNLVDKLNGSLGDGMIYIDTLKSIIGKLEVKQLYMDVILKKDTVLFYLKGFSDENAKITFEAPNVSTPNPGNGRLGFKMK